MDKLISVIVPVYKVEKYLKRCIESIQKQTYQNLEIILVDDGSPDRSGEICDEYAKTDARIKVVHKPNGGLSDARNAGLSICTGELIGFVDSDDYIAPNFFEKLYQYKMEHHAEISVCNYVRFQGETVSDTKTEPKSVKVWKGKEALENIYGSYGHLLSACVWNKLYDADLFENLRFPVGMKNEDEYILPRLIDKAETMVYAEEGLYYYYINEGSITEDSGYLMSDDVYKIFEDRMAYFEDKGEEYARFVRLTKKGYLDRIIARYKKLSNREMLAHYRRKYKEYQKDVNGSGYRIFSISPKAYYWLVKLTGR